MKNYFLLRNKKGDEKTVILVLALAAVVFLTLIFMYNKGYLSFKKNVDAKMSCQGALGVGYGQCQANCDPPSQKIDAPECKKSGLICCVTIGKKPDLGIENYGGDATHDFTVDYIGFEQTSLATLTKAPYNCKVQDPGVDTILICPPDQNIEFTIKIGLSNSGTIPLDVAANPVVVDLTGKYGQFELTQGATLKRLAVPTPANTESLIKFPLTKSGSKASSTLGTTYVIYAGAKCITTECKKTYTAGIFRKSNTDASLSITFQK